MSWNTDLRFPQFEVDGVKFMLTFQEDEFGLEAKILYWGGAEWFSWGGMPDASGLICQNVTDAEIMAKGSLREYLVWLTQEAVRRAKLKAAIPLPDPADRIGRFKYNLLMSVDSDGQNLTVKPAPLP